MTQTIESIAMMILGAVTTGASIYGGFTDGIVFGALTTLAGLLFLLIDKNNKEDNK